MSYVPKINDYVKWSNGKGVEGWIYFCDKEYVTIEIYVRPKDPENYEHCSLHQNERLLVLCHKEQWKELEYIKTRQSIYEEEENSLEMVGKGTR